MQSFPWHRLNLKLGERKALGDREVKMSRVSIMVVTETGYQFSLVVFTSHPQMQCLQFSSVAQSFQLSETPWTTACQVSLSITNSRSLLKLMFTELVMPSNHLIKCHSLLLPPSIFPSIRAFSNESNALCIWWPKYWSFSFNISPFNEHSGLISFRMDWLDLIAVQGTLKSIL